MTDKKKGLGRSLQDLLSPSDWLKRDDIQLFYCPISRIVPNPYQPRKILDDSNMEELIESIREKGILQPILVTRTDTPDTYQIIAGERRWQAATKAGLSEVPVILRDSTDAEALQLALVENIQRRDLNCIEEAIAYHRLQEEFGLTQDEVAQKVGKKRSTVANTLRLLQLPPEIQEDILNEHLTMGHARALLSIQDPDDRRALRNLIIQRGLSVREAEQMARRGIPKKESRTPDPYLNQLQKTLQSYLGVKVALRRRGDRGSILIPFRSDEELEKLLRSLGLPC